nr:hypothetical protein [Patatavirales sp.]
MSKDHIRNLANDLGKFAQQTLLPRESAAEVSGVVRPPNYMGPSKTCAAHTKFAFEGDQTNKAVNGLAGPTSVGGEAWIILSPSIGNMCVQTSNAQYNYISSVTQMSFAGRFRTSLKTMQITGSSIEYKSARPLRSSNDTSVVVFARPDDQGRWVYPIFSNVLATSLIFSFTCSRVIANDPVFAESLNLKLYYRNAATLVWGSITTSGAVDAFNGSAVINVTIPASINIDGWYFTMEAAAGADFTFDYKLDIQSSAPSGAIFFGLPLIANVCVIQPNPLLGTGSAGWAVERAAFISGAVDVNCTASDLTNGGRITGARLQAGQFPTEFGSSGILSTTPTAYTGKFKDGCYGWLLPDLGTYCERTSNHVEYDQSVFIILETENRGTFQIIGDFIMQGCSVSPLYEYRAPTVIPNFQLLIDQLRELPACTENNDHLKFFKRAVSSLVDVVGSKGFATALKAGDAVLEILPNGMVKKVGQVAVGAGKGANKVAAKHSKQKKQINYDVSPAPLPPTTRKAKKGKKPNPSKKKKREVEYL